jgi:hypothetical protein
LFGDGVYTASPRKYVSVRTPLRDLYVRNAPHKTTRYNILQVVTVGRRIAMG